MRCGIGAVHDEPGDPVRQRIRLAGTGAGNDQQRTHRSRRERNVMLDGSTLLGIQAGERIVGKVGFGQNFGQDFRHGRLCTVNSNDCTFTQ